MAGVFTIVALIALTIAIFACLRLWRRRRSVASRTERFSGSITPFTHHGFHVLPDVEAQKSETAPSLQLSQSRSRSQGPQPQIQAVRNQNVSFALASTANYELPPSYTEFFPPELVHNAGNAIVVPPPVAAPSRSTENTNRKAAFVRSEHPQTLTHQVAHENLMVPFFSFFVAKADLLMFLSLTDTPLMIPYSYFVVYF